MGFIASQNLAMLVSGKLSDDDLVMTTDSEDSGEAEIAAAEAHSLEEKKP